MNFYKINLGDFTFKIYGVGITIAFLLFSFLLYKNIKDKKLDLDFFVHHYWKWIIGGGIIARLVSFIFYSIEINQVNFWNLAAFWNGGAHAWSFVLGFFATAFLDLKAHKKNPLQWLDALVVPFVSSVLILDIFGFITGAIHGTQTSLPWGVRYETFGVDILTAVHPITIYAFIIHWFLLRWAKRHEKPYQSIPSKLFLYTTGPYLFIEFLLHFLRADHTFLVWEFIRFDQLIILGLLFFLLLWFLQFKKKRSKA
jgi:prolipoprotein diacylglyceryltransferase